MADLATAPVAEAAPPPETFTAPEPVKITPREAPKEEAKKPSLKESLAAAKVKVEAKEAAEADPKALKTAPKEPVKTEPKAKAEPDPKVKPEEVKPERPRGEHGHFTADPNKTAEENEAARVAAEKAPPKTPAKADSTDHKQPLQRFSQAAKDAWPTVPEDAQKEIHRAFREVEAGLTKHREGSTRYSEVFKEFDDIAKSSNVDAKATLQSYVNIDRALHSGNPQHIVGAINEVLKSAGVTPQQYAQAIMGTKAQQPGEQPSAQPSREVTELRETVKRLEQKLGGVEQHLQGETMTKHEQTLTEWAADKPHFEALRGEITRLVIEDNLLPDDAYANALVAAQDKARAFLGDEASSASRDNPLKKAAEELAEQIDRGSKSIKGAPSAGSEPPPHTGPLPSIKESLRKARLKASA